MKKNTSMVPVADISWVGLCNGNWLSQGVEDYETGMLLYYARGCQNDEHTP